MLIIKEIGEVEINYETKSLFLVSFEKEFNDGVSVSFFDAEKETVYGVCECRKGSIPCHDGGEETLFNTRIPTWENRPSRIEYGAGVLRGYKGCKVVFYAN